MEECTFCKIIAGKMNSHLIYEDHHTLVILDTAKDVDYHMLVIPKKHIYNILDCDESSLTNIMTTVKKVSTHCVNQLGFDGVNMLSASNEAAGQSVPHFHVHLIPRKLNDRINAWPILPGATVNLAEASSFLKQ